MQVSSMFKHIPSLHLARLLMTVMSVRKCSSKKADQVLDAARRLFLERGFDATSMDDVAEMAGVSKATVYAHYNCKTALFAEVIHHECQRSKVHRAIAGKIKGNYSLERSEEHTSELQSRGLRVCRT